MLEQELALAAFNNATAPPEPIANLGKLPDICDWAEDRFYVMETGKPIELQPHQKTILRLITEQLPNGQFRWRNVLYSTIKKSGKTTISALYARWAAETWGNFQEVYNLGNKLKQAKDRAFKTVKRSIMMAPEHERKEWDVQETRLTHLPSNSIIEALPISGAGEAGGNQSLTVWTELWGFQYDDALLMWDELKPVPTRPLSQRFVDTYAGFEGISMLLWNLWLQGLEGEQLVPDLPVFGNSNVSLIAYIDQGVAARRMPWQRGEEGRKYYLEEERQELPENFTRHHMNEWTTSQNALINIAVWNHLGVDGLKGKRGQTVVLAADASVSGDSTALAVIAYDHARDKIIELETHIWEPPKGGKMDYTITLAPEIKRCLAFYKVIGIAYDPYQLHDFMTRLRKEIRKDEEFVYEFPQQGDRVKADTALLQRIRQERIEHSDNDKLREHVQNADGKNAGDNAIRIVKRSDKHQVDGIVAVSMGAARILELLLNKPNNTPRKIGGGGARLYGRR